MSDEYSGATPNDDDVRSAIGAAFDEVTADDKAPAAEAPDKSDKQFQYGLEKAPERARDEQGRFAPKGDEPAPAAVAKPAKQAPEAQAAPALAKTPATVAPIVSEGPHGEQPAGLRPPPGWSVAAKAAFDVLPEPVKAAVAKREEEISNGFAKLAEYKGMEQYAEMARQNGKTLPDVLAAYRSAETTLQNDPVNGIVQLSQMYNANPVEIIAGIAQAYGVISRLSWAIPRACLIKTACISLDWTRIPHATFRLSNTGFRQLSHAFRLSSNSRKLTNSLSSTTRLSRFQSNPAHQYFENVRPLVAHFLRMPVDIGGPKDLSEAYQMALNAHPETRQMFINEQIAKSQADAKAKSDKAKATTKSLHTGSPMPGAARTAGNQTSSVRDDLLASWDEAAA
jgi:hypothetical protein